MSRHLMRRLSQKAFLKDVSNPEQLDELLTLDDLALYLSVRKEKASMLAHCAIGCYKIGSRVFVSRTIKHAEWTKSME
jgi:hypothetical protein